jgi:hypothetical protein
LASLGYRRSGDHRITFVSENRSLSLTLVISRSEIDAATCLRGRDTPRDRSGLLRGLTNLSELADSDSPCGFHLLLRPPHVRRHFQINRASWCGGSCIREVRCRRIEELKIGRGKMVQPASNSCRAVLFPVQKREISVKRIAVVGYLPLRSASQAQHSIEVGASDNSAACIVSICPHAR